MPCIFSFSTNLFAYSFIYIGIYRFVYQTSRGFDTKFHVNSYQTSQTNLPNFTCITYHNLPKPAIYQTTRGFQPYLYQSARYYWLLTGLAYQSARGLYYRRLKFSSKQGNSYQTARRVKPYNIPNCTNFPVSTYPLTLRIPLSFSQLGWVNNATKSPGSFLLQFLP